MESYNYKCEYCSKLYTPRRRKVQKYCSSTCRVKAHFQRNKQLVSKKETGLSNEVNSDNKKKDTINLAGIGNAAIANVATDALISFLTPEDNKPATKGDLKKLLAQFKNRYVKIENMPKKLDQTEAFFDNERKVIVYLKVSPTWR
jgi:hypothetical protein